MNFYDKILFANHLEEDESLQYVVHKHWFEIFKPALATTLFGIVPPILLVVFLVGITTSNPLFWFAGAWLILGLISFFYTCVDWYYDAWLLTDQCVIDIKWNGLFERTAWRVEYPAINGVAYELKGFWGFLLGFGDMRIEKTSSQTVELRNASKPREAEAQIVELQEKFLEGKNSTDSEAIKSLLAEVIKTHIKNKK